MISEKLLESADDYYHAAMIFQHGETLDEIRQACHLANEALTLGSESARWLSAATLDRWLMYQGKPQKYGTQFVPDGQRQRLWDLDPTTTDEERARMNVPSLAAQLKRAQELTLSEPMPPMDDAPQWLKDAIDRWKKYAE
jgi:hypothetical protein